ncbi:hypothetical Protein YC6258_01967 [Gynuella sunshinyii YC6258]|uniref:Uncharacterized protein n=1 Tax=Gynuella sunshinyii YC6258 TaxID=1445510 RepID=A0A0C5VIB9_9GAMM|nr:hypothetical Protein YC6258_01967 [Gynuella sunshinyii YC6258]
MEDITQKFLNNTDPKARTRPQSVTSPLERIWTLPFICDRSVSPAQQLYSL